MAIRLLVLIDLASEGTDGVNLVVATLIVVVLVAPAVVALFDLEVLDAVNDAALCRRLLVVTQGCLHGGKAFIVADGVLAALVEVVDGEDDSALLAAT